MEIPIGSIPHAMLMGAYIPGTFQQLGRYKFLLLPSYREGCPNVLSEAYSYGVPVVGASIPGIQEHIRSVSGIMIERPLNTARIAEAILRASSMPQREYAALCKRVVEYHAAHFQREQAAMWIQQLSQRLLDREAVALENGDYAKMALG
jgi:glycosyltransferase involved in cell wall biosynthesis